MASPSAADLTGVTNPDVDLAPASLTLTRISPQRAYTVGRDRITLTGTGFDNRTEFTFAGQAAEVESVTPTTAVVFAPSSASWGQPVTVVARRPSDGARATNSNTANSMTAFSYAASSLDFRMRDSYSIINGSYTSHRFGLWSDVNNDGRPEMVIAHASNFHSVFQNNGTGDLVNVYNDSNGPSQPGAFKAIMTQLDNDNIPDFIIVDSGSTWVYRLMNTSFQTTRGTQGTGGVCSGIFSVDAADYNGDNFRDMLFACLNNNRLDLHNNQFGTNNNVNAIFPTSPSVSLSVTNPTHAAFTDLNNDGKPDIVAVSNANNGTTLYWWFNNNNAYPNTPTGSTGTNNQNQNPQWLTCADLNNDKFPDCAITDINTNTVRVFLNNGTGTLALTGNPILVGPAPRQVSFDDVNNDGFQDMLVANANGHNFSVIPGRGDGSFGTITAADGRVLVSRVTIALGCRFAWSVSTVDVDGDGLREVSASCQNNDADDATRGAIRTFRNISR